MNKLVRISATLASSLALVAGFSGAAFAQGTTISHTGDHSKNVVKSRNQVKTFVRNDNDVQLDNHNYQSAYSGNANVKNNDDVDSVTTGNTSNSNTTDATVTLTNSTPDTSGGMGADSMSGSGGSGGNVTVNHTGDHSLNVVKSDSSVDTFVSNDNDVSVDNTNCQTASSGNANVKNNDDVGSVTTGDASNTNSSTFSVSITNN